MHADVHQQFALPPMPPAIHGPATPMSAPEEVLSGWLEALEAHAKQLREYNVAMEIECLTYWARLIDAADNGYRTNVISVRDMAKAALASSSIKEVDEVADQIKKIARKLHTVRSPLASHATRVAASFGQAVKATKVSLQAGIDNANRIIERLPDAKNSPTYRAAAVYQQALKLVLANENASWKLHDFQTADPSECFPWYEVFVSPDIRSNRKILRAWERAIDKAVEDVDPNLLGAVGINYSVTPQTA